MRLRQAGQPIELRAGIAPVAVMTATVSSRLSSGTRAKMMDFGSSS
jgi:hypothetical protein